MVAAKPPSGTAILEQVCDQGRQSDRNTDREHVEARPEGRLLLFDMDASREPAERHETDKGKSDDCPTMNNSASPVDGTPRACVSPRRPKSRR